MSRGWSKRPWKHAFKRWRAPPIPLTPEQLAERARQAWRLHASPLDIALYDTMQSLKRQMFLDLYGDGTRTEDRNFLGLVALIHDDKTK